MELVSDIITKERRSRPLPNAARRISLPSLIARDVEIRLINDPLELASSFDPGKLLARTCFTLFENTFSTRVAARIRIRRTTTF